MEIPYKYIVLVLVILAIVCVIMTVECFSSNDDEEFKEIKDKIMEGYNQENIDKNYVSADSIMRNMDLDDEKNILVTPRLQLATKYLSTENAEQIYDKLFNKLKLTKDENGAYVMNFNPDNEEVEMNEVTVGDYLREHLDTHLEDILANQINGYSSLTRDQQGQVYRVAKTQLNRLMQDDVKRYHEAIRYAPLKGDGSEQVEYQDGVVAIPAIMELIRHLLGEPYEAQEQLPTPDLSATIDSRIDIDNKFYDKPMYAYAKSESLKTMVKMLTYAGQKFLNIDTSELDFITDGNIEIPFSDDFRSDELHTQNEINEELEKFVGNLIKKPEDPNNLVELEQLQESRELPVSLRRRVRYNRDFVANAIANILNSRAIQKGWNWKKDVANFNILRKTNINPNIIYSTKLSKIARILNVDESNILDPGYPAKYKILRAGGIIDSLGGSISSETKNFIYDTIFNLEHDQYNSLEETISLPLTTNLQVSNEQDKSQRQPEEIISDDDIYKMQKIETVLKHATIEGIYECVPARFVRSDSSTTESGELVRLRCELGLPLYVYDYKPTDKNESSMLQKIGRGILSGNMIIESYRNGERGREELGDNEVIFITDKSYNTNKTEKGTGLDLSNGEFVYEENEGNEKMIDSKKVTYVVAQEENVEVEVTKVDGSTEIITEKQRVYKYHANGQLSDYTIENKPNWTVKELKDKFDKEEEGSTLRFEVALIQQLINDSVDEPESNFDLNDYNLFPITYRDPYPLVPLESLEISRRDFTYPNSEDSVPIRIAGEDTNVSTKMEVNKKEVLAVYRITSKDDNNTVYTRDTPASLSGMNMNDGIDISQDGLTKEKALQPILKCSDPSTQLGQSVIFGEQGDVQVQVIRKASDINEDGQMEKDGENIIDYNVHRTYIDASGNTYDIETIDINKDIGWKTQELRDLFNFYKNLLDDEKDYLNQLKLKANCYDLVLINRLMVIIANSKLKAKNSKLNKRPRNNFSIVLETEKRLTTTTVQSDFQNYNINENLLNLISDSLSNSQICKSGGSSEISVNEIQNMGIMNFKSIFESNILHVESLNLRNSTKVMFKDAEDERELNDVNGLGIYFLNHTDVNRLMKAIYGSFNGYIDTDDFQSDTMFGLVKMYEIIISFDGGLDTFKKDKDLSGEFIENGLDKVMAALDNLRTEKTKNATEPQEIRWKVSEFKEQNWLESALLSGDEDEFKFKDREEVHDFLSQIYAKIQLNEFLSTRMHTVGMVPIDGGNVDVNDYVSELRQNVESLNLSDMEKNERMEIVNEYAKRTRDDSFDDARLQIIVDTLNSNLSKRLGRQLIENDEIVSQISTLGDIRNLFVRNMYPKEDETQSTQVVESGTTDTSSASTIINNVNINKEDFSPLDNRSNKKQIDSVITGISNNDVYFSLDNSYSLLN